MTESYIQKIGEITFGEMPNKIIRKTIGMCNEVYELQFSTQSCILRMNYEKEWIFGTHKFLPLFKRFHIKAPEILAEDYSKSTFSFCYQVLTKLEGKDLLLVMDTLSHPELTEIAVEVSNVFDQFNTLPSSADFGMMTGLNEHSYDCLFEELQNQKKGLLERNNKTNVIDAEIFDIRETLLREYKPYFLAVKPKMYYDDICSKNVMIHNGKFNGLVDLDFLIKGDYLEAIGRMIADWYGNVNGEYYIQEIIRLQKLDSLQQKIIKVYAILNLIGWLSEEGIQFNSNSTGEVNWERVHARRERIKALYRSL